MLTVSEMPSGWAVDNSGEAGSRGCDKAAELLKAAAGAKANAYAAFDQQQLPDVEELLVAYSNPTTASSAYTTATTDLNTCKGYTASGSTAQIGEMSFPTLGNRSTAYQVTATIQGIAAGSDEIIALKGSQVVVLAYSDIGGPSVSDVQPIFTTAIGKITSS